MSDGNCCSEPKREFLTCWIDKISAACSILLAYLSKRMFRFCSDHTTHIGGDRYAGMRGDGRSAFAETVRDLNHSFVTLIGDARQIIRSCSDRSLAPKVHFH